MTMSVGANRNEANTLKN